MAERKFLVQSGYGRGSYETRYALDTLGEAVRWYEGINTHSGHKKRLVDPEGKVLDRYISEGRKR